MTKVTGMKDGAYDENEMVITISPKQYSMGVAA